MDEAVCLDVRNAKVSSTYLSLHGHLNTSVLDTDSGLNIMTTFPLDTTLAFTAVKSLRDLVNTLSPSTLDLVPILLLHSDQRKQKRASTDASLSQIDATLAELGSLAKTTISLYEKVAQWRLWVSQPLRGVRALPDELLSQIFSIAAGTDGHRWKMVLTISQTCALWRRVSVQCSPLWQNFLVKIPRHIQLLPLFATRSGALGVNIVLGSSSQSQRRLWRLVGPKSLPIQADVATKIRGLSSLDYDAIEALSFPQENFESLSLERSGVNLSRLPSDEGQTISLPAYMLESRYLAILHPPQAPIRLESSSITTLALAGGNYYKIISLLELAELPNLSCLHLRNSCHIQHPTLNGHSEPSIMVESVETLDLRECEDGFVENIPFYLVFPNLQSLSFHQKPFSRHSTKPDALISWVSMQIPRRNVSG
ncbi:hypothetical protein DL93DRAFT_1598927 [Clavulina sp. PMI_390]|nr:hypothetical protein DL93DRAFT_1598927 [Clavulina sp. PMI_390]